jgi:hypothetical protein
MPPVFDAIDEELWVLRIPTVLTIHTDEGYLQYSYKAGFTSNGRSGPAILNMIIPKWGGSELYRCAILLHDSNYTQLKSLDMQHPLSKALSDSLLRQMAVASKEISSFRGWSMENGLYLFGQGAYDEPATDPYARNPELLDFHWNSGPFFSKGTNNRDRAIIYP